MADAAPTLRIYNTLTRVKEEFAPIDRANVRMYVCGPTVYDFAHIGNARPAIVFDVVFRLLRHLYGADHVTYVRNITDVDDKINARALRDFPELPLNEAIRRVTETTNNQYQKDVAALGCLPPTFQPRATEFVQPRADGKTDMIGLIQNLITRGHAYEAAGEVLFDTASMADYGQLSKRRLDEQQAGARVEVDAHKKSPGDFVLWKASSENEPGWPSPWGRGRPGWHIECSAMSAAYLGEVFDIHGGGLDLIFPHHENEIAQSRCAHGTAVMANYWMHNGFLQVEGRKMSKSDGNFVTIHELLETEKFGGRKWPGEVLRLAMLMTHYREPIDFSVRRLEEAEAIFVKCEEAGLAAAVTSIPDMPSPELITSLQNDLDFTEGLKHIQKLAAGKSHNAGQLARDLSFLGLAPDIDSLTFGMAWAIQKGSERSRYQRKYLSTIRGPAPAGLIEEIFQKGDVNELINQRNSAKASKDFAVADMIKKNLVDVLGLILTDSPTGTTWSIKRRVVDDWMASRNSAFLQRKLTDAEKDQIDELILMRLECIKSGNWFGADQIWETLLAKNIEIKDGKNPATGERITTWEVKR